MTRKLSISLSEAAYEFIAEQPGSRSAFISRIIEDRATSETSERSASVDCGDDGRYTIWRKWGKISRVEIESAGNFGWTTVNSDLPVTFGVGRIRISVSRREVKRI